MQIFEGITSEKICRVIENLSKHVRSLDTPYDGALEHNYCIMKLSIDGLDSIVKDYSERNGRFVQESRFVRTKVVHMPVTFEIFSTKNMNQYIGTFCKCPEN